MNKGVYLVFIFIMGLISGCFESTTSPAPVVNPPNAPKVTNVVRGTGKVVISWTGVTDAQSYKVFQSGTSEMNYAEIDPYTIKTNFYYSTIALTNQAIFFKVKAVNAGGESSFSDEYKLEASTTTSTATTLSSITGIDTEGTEYKGNYLLVVNENRNTSTTENSGVLSNISSMKKSELTINEDISYLERRINPRRAEPAEKRIITPSSIKRGMMYSVGSTKTFWTYNYKTTKDDQTTATLQYSGSRCNIWANNTSEITTANANKLGTEFDNNIYNVVTNTFYTPSDVNGNGKVDILCYDIQDTYSTTSVYTGGYFWSGDLMTYSNSNGMELFYIDTYPTMYFNGTSSKPGNVIYVENAYSTLAHEFQHMVNYNKVVMVDGKRSSSEPEWLDEGLSMAAEHIYTGKALDYRVKYFNTDKNNAIRNGHSFIANWNDSNDILSDYAMAYLFMQYFKIQCGVGDIIYKQILDGSDVGYATIENLAKEYISPDMTFEKLMTSFRIAVIRNDKTGLYGFENTSVLNTVSQPLFTGSSVNLNGGGAIVKAISGKFTEPATHGNVKYVGITK